ncbi:MAG: hypothetical protein JXR51_02185 [Bacteroidales bacterium]|nr:hypothetical protein [Bacteroidales bacterium]
MLFNFRVSVGGDDAAYIIRASDFINHFKYPSFQGPLYPFVLSILILFFGINIPLLKLLSAIFLALHLYILFKTFKIRVPNFVLISSIALISINSYLAFFASQTYSETFFMLLQILFFAYFFKNFITDNIENYNIKIQIIRYLIIGFFVFLMGITKSIGNISLIAIIIYFVFEKKWKAISYSIASFSLFFSVWKAIKMILWGNQTSQFTEQAKVLFQKHPYDPSLGQETFFGFFNRLIDNSNLYFSKHLYTLFGLRPDVCSPIPFLAIIIVIALLISFIAVYKKNKYLLFTGIYLFLMLGFTFVILQTIWESIRLILAFFPFFVLFFIGGFYYLFKDINLKNYQFILVFLVAFLFYFSFTNSIEKIEKHKPILKENFKGNLLAGLSPDWVNYIKMCKWVADNIPENERIACRKPNISFIYTNRRFYGIYKVNSENADTLLQNLYKNNVKYIIMASLRKFEERKSEYTINTIQRYLYYIQTKYPEKIKPLYQIGNDEPAYLFKIN